jgi:hypothetical protein
LVNSDDGDIQMGVSLANLYGTASGDLKNQPKSKRKDLEAMLNEGYVKSSVKFENGRAVIEMKNIFGEELKSKMFLSGDS